MSAATYLKTLPYDAPNWTKSLSMVKQHPCGSCSSCCNACKHSRPPCICPAVPRCSITAGVSSLLQWSLVDHMPTIVCLMLSIHLHSHLPGGMRNDGCQFMIDACLQVPRQRVSLGLLPTPLHSFTPPHIPDNIEMFIKRERLQPHSIML